MTTAPKLTFRRAGEADLVWAANSPRWHDRHAPTPSEWHVRLFDHAFAHAVLESDGGERFLFYGVSPNWVNGTAYLVAHCSDVDATSPLFVPALRAFSAWVFDVWPARRLYYEWLDLFDAPADLFDFASVQGRLLDHRFVQGRYRDVVVFSIAREQLS